MDDKYIEVIKKHVLNPEIVKEQGEELKVVYTPLHGPGTRLIKRVFEELGFEHLYVVPEQAEPDGNSARNAAD